MAELDEDSNCVLCGIPPEMCAHRAGLPKEEPANPHAFDARYEGHCPACDQPILLGESIVVRWNDRPIVAIHEECN